VARALQFILVMRIKDILLGLGILGSSTIALADAPLRGSWSRRDNVVYRQPAITQYRDVTYRPTTWQALTAAERLDRRGDMFDLQGRARFSQLRLQNQAGRTHVRQIEIVFADGTTQRVRVNRALAGNHDMINIDLDGDARRIDKIFVDGRSARAGSYQLYAM
jgi:hypothetical protein